MMRANRGRELLCESLQAATILRNLSTVTIRVNTVTTPLSIKTHEVVRSYTHQRGVAASRKVTTRCGIET